MSTSGSTDWKDTTLGIPSEEGRASLRSSSLGYLSASSVPPNFPTSSAPSSKGKNAGNVIHNGTWEDLGIGSIQ